MRDIMLSRDDPGEWVDPACVEMNVTLWPKCLFFLGRDCAKSNRRLRPEMMHVFNALEKLHKSPMPLALQSYYDAKSNAVQTFFKSSSDTLAPSYRS
jgi:hypothetical protein